MVGLIEILAFVGAITLLHAFLVKAMPSVFSEEGIKKNLDAVIAQGTYHQDDDKSG